MRGSQFCPWGYNQNPVGLFTYCKQKTKLRRWRYDASVSVDLFPWLLIPSLYSMCRDPVVTFKSASQSVKQVQWYATCILSVLEWLFSCEQICSHDRAVCQTFSNGQFSYTAVLFVCNFPASGVSNAVCLFRWSVWFGLTFVPQ